MKIEFHGLIKVDKDRQVNFGETLNYKSISGMDVSVYNHDKDNDSIVCKFNLESENIEEAKTKAEFEIARLANLLSWYRDTKVVDFRINGYQYIEQDGKQSAVVLADTVRITTHVSIVVTMGKEGVEKLGKRLANEVSDDFLDVITLWSDAVHQPSEVTRFFLLFRILEKMIGERRQVEPWIKAQEPNVEMRQTRDGLVTVYTYLRDNIHPKTENFRFPFSDVSKYVNSLQILVQKLIIEKFPEADIS